LILLVMTRPVFCHRAQNSKYKCAHHDERGGRPGMFPCDPVSVHFPLPVIMLKVATLWATRRLQCVWRCDDCDAVCCRVRREMFRCVCGHALKHHDPKRSFACGCQAKKTASPSAVHKGDCGCPGFNFLVSHGAWTVKCRCKHDAASHDPATLRCRRCDVGGRGTTDAGCAPCEAWQPAFQCHCGHSCGRHRTCFVRGYLGSGHRDWVR